MNKLILFFIALLAYSTCFAQVRNETTFGLRLGINYSDLDTDFFEDPENRIAPEVIFFAEIPLGSTFTIVPEVGFSALGVKEARIETSDGNGVDFKTNWLTAGFLAQVNITDWLYLNAGPKFALNISENDEGDYYDSDVMGVGGLGFRVTQNFSVDARYGYGFTNVFEGSLEDQGFEAENRFYQLTVSYRM